MLGERWRTSRSRRVSAPAATASPASASRPGGSPVGFGASGALAHPSAPTALRPVGFARESGETIAPGRMLPHGARSGGRSGRSAPTRPGATAPSSSSTTGCSSRTPGPGAALHLGGCRPRHGRGGPDPLEKAGGPRAKEVPVVRSVREAVTSPIARQIRETGRCRARARSRPRSAGSPANAPRPTLPEAASRSISTPPARAWAPTSYRPEPAPRATVDTGTAVPSAAASGGGRGCTVPGFLLRETNDRSPAKDPDRTDRAPARASVPALSRAAPPGGLAGRPPPAARRPSGARTDRTGLGPGRRSRAPSPARRPGCARLARGTTIGRSGGAGSDHGTRGGDGTVVRGAAPRDGRRDAQPASRPRARDPARAGGARPDRCRARWRDEGARVRDDPLSARGLRGPRLRHRGGLLAAVGGCARAHRREPAGYAG